MSGGFCPSETTTNQDGNHGAVPSLFGRRGSERGNHVPALLRCEPIADAYAKPTGPPTLCEFRPPNLGLGDRNPPPHRPTDAPQPVWD